LVPKRGVLRKAPFAISLAMLLAGCTEQWSISKVVVNPQPLSTDPVTPIVLSSLSSQIGKSLNLPKARDIGTGPTFYVAPPPLGDDGNPGLSRFAPRGGGVSGTQL